MSLSIIQNATAMATNLTCPFSGIGGTEPYVYSVVPGGAGGTINSSTGIYTSPSGTGIDTILVTDALLATAETTILVATPLELFCDIIETEMGLSQGQVYLWDQKLNIPKDSRLYIAVGILSCKPFGNSNTLNSNGDSVQSVNMSAMLSIDILSRSKDARNRKEEIILALGSDYAERQQELNSFYVSRLTNNFVNLSEEDGAAIPYRFNITATIQYFVSKTSAVSYYDTFSTSQVNTN